MATEWLSVREAIAHIWDGREIPVGRCCSPLAG